MVCHVQMAGTCFQDGATDEKVERGRVLRATIARYILATCFIVCHSISAKFARVYPGAPLDTMVRLGFLTPEEALTIEKRKDCLPYLSELHFIPTVWAQYVARQAYKEGQIIGADESTGDQGMLFTVYLPFPIMLCQVVTILTHSYIIVTIFAQQDNAQAKGEMSFHFPFFTCLDTLCYLGALRVGQTFLNPLGDEDDDYEIVAFFNRNLRLVHLYGLFGTQSSGGFEDLPMPEIRDLREEQDKSIPTIPVDFFNEKKSSFGAFDDVPPMPSLESDARLLTNETSSSPGVDQPGTGFSGMTIDQGSFIIPNSPQRTWTSPNIGRSPGRGSFTSSFHRTDSNTSQKV